MENQKREFDITKFKEFIKKERTVEQLEKEFELSEFEIMGYVSKLKKAGLNIIVAKKDDAISVINLGDRKLNNDNSYKLDIGDATNVKIAVISDTRLCSKSQQLSILNDIYLKAQAENIHHILHCGDISEGLYSSKSQYYDSIFEYDTNQQANYIINNYPSIDDIKTYFITGNQDLTHIKKNGIDIGKLISAERDDLIYLGANRCTITIRNFDILMQHPKSKIAYTVSYKPQKFISSMRSEDKPDILLHGHWLHAEKMPFRGVEEFSVPGLVATTPRMMDEGIQNTTGAWFLNIFLNSKGELDKVLPRFIPYYVTDKNDYIKAKVLKLGGRK
ncbi:MAG: metallophosphoesterase family protein [Bacilli bacterium]|nr:metallophosphoesterase family protein [Bacilli bacterium]MDD4053927.1 metallophosphoesterase family protein [Bacilli bacterium]